MRSAVLVVVVVALAAGCMGDDGDKGDPAAVALREYMQSAPGNNDRLPANVPIPEADEFFVVKQGEWSVPAVELESEFGAFAAPVRREGDEWRVRGPVKELRIVEGPPEPGGAVGFDQRVGFGVYSDEQDVTADLWVDGEKQQLAGVGGREFTRYWATPETLGAGRHLAVVLARGGDDAAAVAWTFTTT